LHVQQTTQNGLFDVEKPVLSFPIKFFQKVSNFFVATT